jgi:competence protein ComEC
MRRAVLVLVCWISMVAAAPSKTLNIYFVDVEGGQSTLIVTPGGQSLLVDAGFPGFDDRDPERIMAAARDAGVTKIDYMLVTHFHADHVGSRQRRHERRRAGDVRETPSSPESSGCVASESVGQ